MGIAIGCGGGGGSRGRDGSYRGFLSNFQASMYELEHLDHDSARHCAASQANHVCVGDNQ